MPVSGWRRPAFAPVYALTTAFALVAGIGLLTPKPALTVRVDKSGPEATAEVFEKSGKPVDADIQVQTVKVGQVQIEFESKPAPAKVLLRDNTSVESFQVTGNASYQPRRSLAGQTICVEPPPGWMVQEDNMVETNGTWCTAKPIGDPGNDFTVRLAVRSLQ